jgi:cellulose synthase (UDP-forming)
VQRQRWARGAIQILYLRDGPFGRGLTLMQRLLFLPTHWLSLGLRSLLAIIAPVVFLWTGLSPVFDVSPADVLFYFVPMVLALTGGVRAFAPGQHFALASQVQGTFLSFKILPTVVATLMRPFGHPFKVTPKGGTSQSSHYARGIFWMAGGLMGLTILGLIVNTFAEWRIVDNAEVLPVLAFWSAINVVVLFLVCMMSLQAPMRRAEERFELDEQIWIVAPNGTLSTGRIRDMSLSGVGLEGDGNRALAAQLGERVRVFITEVGFVAGTVARQRERFLGVQFDLPVSVERDLLIRKLFTAGRDTVTLASALSATGAMLKRIWNMRADMLDAEPPDGGAVVVTLPVEKLPARSLVVAPQRRAPLADLVEQRKGIAA